MKQGKNYKSKSLYLGRASAEKGKIIHKHLVKRLVEVIDGRINPLKEIGE